MIIQIYDNNDNTYIIKTMSYSTWNIIHLFPVRVSVFYEIMIHQNPKRSGHSLDNSVSKKTNMFGLFNPNTKHLDKVLF